MISFLKWNLENENEKETNFKRFNVDYFKTFIQIALAVQISIFFLCKPYVRAVRHIEKVLVTYIDPTKISTVRLNHWRISSEISFGQSIDWIQRRRGLIWITLTQLWFIGKKIIFHRKNNWNFFKKFVLNLVKLREKTMKQFTLLKIDDANNWFTLALFIDSRCFLLTFGAEHFFPYKIFSNIHLKTKNPFW